jgi:ribulose-5-phosphate 4-epimerase/fuculose-1-phosphate aldolase
MNAPARTATTNSSAFPDREHLREARIDLTAALRWAARLGFNEGVCNHFSLELGPDRYLINPQGLHWSEVTAGDMLLIDGSGRVLEGRHALEPTAFFIHSWIHRTSP